MSAFTLGVLSVLDFAGSLRVMKNRDQAVLDDQNLFHPGDVVTVTRRVVYNDGLAISSDASFVMQDLERGFIQAGEQVLHGRG
jgi:hypothetical protein